jgi:hypothetical protein
MAETLCSPLWTIPEQRQEEERKRAKMRQTCIPAAESRLSANIAFATPPARNQIVLVDRSIFWDKAIK